MEIQNKNVIITGAASGLGKELTKQMVVKGARVAALDINADNLKKLQDELGAQNVKTYVVNMGDRQAVKDFKQSYLQDFDSVDILINNAGIIQPFDFVENITEETIDRVMNVNFYGPLFLIRNFINDFKNSTKEQYIVNISSMGGFFPFPQQTIYGASKAALKIFSEGLYAEMKNTNNHVMVVFPGAINTNIAQNSNVKINLPVANDKQKQTSYKMLEAADAAKQVIRGIEKNKFKLFLGSDAKFMKFMYKLNSKKAIDLITKKMLGA